jgi:hypothetical protein
VTLLAGPLLCALLVLAVIKAKRAGVSGGKVALIAIVGGLCIPVAMLGILAWGFADFG